MIIILFQVPIIFQFIFIAYKYCNPKENHLLGSISGPFKTSRSGSLWNLQVLRIVLSRLGKSRQCPNTGIISTKNYCPTFKRIWSGEIQGNVYRSTKRLHQNKAVYFAWSLTFEMSFLSNCTMNTFISRVRFLCHIHYVSSSVI